MQLQCLVYAESDFEIWLTSKEMTVWCNPTAVQYTYVYNKPILSILTLPASTVTASYFNNVKYARLSSLYATSEYSGLFNESYNVLSIGYSTVNAHSLLMLIATPDPTVLICMN